MEGKKKVKKQSMLFYRENNSTAKVK